MLVRRHLVKNAVDGRKSRQPGMLLIIHSYPDAYIRKKTPYQIVLSIKIQRVLALAIDFVGLTMAWRIGDDSGTNAGCVRTPYILPKRRAKICIQPVATLLARPDERIELDFYFCRPRFGGSSPTEWQVARPIFRTTAPRCSVSITFISVS